MTDIEQAAAAVRRHPAHPMLAVDNTLLGPTFQHPLVHGAHLAIYSATKFLGGFSDLLAGAVLAADPELIQSLTGVRALLGNILQADECWILDSRLSTVGLRMNRQSKNAQRIAEELAKNPRVKRVIYPSLFSDPEQIRIRDAQTDYPGSLLSLIVDGGKTAAFDFLRRLRIAKNAVSLGGVETLVCHPMTTTHSELSDDELKASRRHNRRTRPNLNRHRTLARPTRRIHPRPRAPQLKLFMGVFVICLRPSSRIRAGLLSAVLAAFPSNRRSLDLR
jgi:cystathionine beta-lyase/cystathionine gamma-synthase